MSKLIPVLLLLVGIAGGVGAGLVLAPEPLACPEAGDGEAAPPPEGCPPPPDPVVADESGGEGGEAPAEFVRMNDQFVIPVLRDGEARALVVLSLTLEVEPGRTGAIFEIEPRLRDALLLEIEAHRGDAAPERHRQRQAHVPEPDNPDFHLVHGRQMHCFLPGKSRPSGRLFACA